MMNDEAPLPEDPRECCRQASTILMAPAHDNWPQRNYPEAALALAASIGDRLAVMLGEATVVGGGDADVSAGEAKALSMLAEMALENVRERADAEHRAHVLARHGTGDFRQLDRAAALRRQECEKTACS